VRGLPGGLLTRSGASTCAGVSAGPDTGARSGRLRKRAESGAAAREEKKSLFIFIFKCLAAKTPF
jgi:hypothetical protein